MDAEVREFLESLAHASTYKTWSAGEVIDSRWIEEAQELLDKYPESVSG